MKRAFLLIVVALLVLLAVLLFNTLKLKEPGETVIPLPVFESALNESEMTARLSRALRFATLPDQPQAFDGFHDFLHQSFPLSHDALTLKTFGHSLLYHWDSGKDCAPTLLLAHQDVVPVSSPDAWEHPPFAGVVDSQFVWGRGAMDDKGSLMAILEATEALLADGRTPACDVWLAFGHDEETGGSEGASRMADWMAEQDLRLSLIHI